MEALLADNPSERDYARLRDIQTQLSALDGAEAAVEGFGSLSGRPSRKLVNSLVRRVAKALARLAGRKARR